MANAVQPSALAWMLSPIPAGTVKALLVDDGYTYSAAHDFLDDVVAGVRVGTAQTVTTSVTLEALSATSSPTFTTVTNPSDVAGVWLYLDAGSDATRRLLAFYDRRADTTAVTFTPDGGNLTLTWSGPLFTI